MLKRTLAVLALCTLTQTVLAEQCPSISQIRSNSLSGWIAQDSEDHTALTTHRMAQFRVKAEQFVLAEWANPSSKEPSKSMRCFYRDKNGSTLEAYLIKTNFIPSDTTHWYEVSGAMQCAEGNQACAFKPLVTQTQLARK